MQTLSEITPPPKTQPRPSARRSPNRAGGRSTSRRAYLVAYLLQQASGAALTVGTHLVRVDLDVSPRKLGGKLLDVAVEGLLRSRRMVGEDPVL